MEYDALGFTNIDVKLMIGDFESIDSPGKHDGDKVVQAVLDLYEMKSTIVLNS